MQDIRHHHRRPIFHRKTSEAASGGIGVASLCLCDRAGPESFERQEVQGGEPGA